MSARKLHVTKYEVLSKTEDIKQKYHVTKRTEYRGVLYIRDRHKEDITVTKERKLLLCIYEVTGIADSV